MQHMEIWPAIFRNHGWNPDEPKSILEIGCFEGLATCWMLSNLLKHPDSKIVCIDTFEGGEEHVQAGIEMAQVREKFSKNLSQCGRVDSVRVIEERSDEGLLRLLQEKQEPFDFIYVDGPATHDVKGKINGVSFSNVERTVMNGDLLTNVNLRDLYRFHFRNKYLLSLCYKLTNNPIGKGVMELNKDSKIIKFEEKPEVPFSNKIYSGIQVLNSKIFGKLPFNDIEDNNYMNLDFGYHIWPQLKGQMSAYKLDCFLIDIGTINAYKKAERLWKN